MDSEDSRYKSRKFRIALYVLISTPMIPIVYKLMSITDTALMGVLGVVTAISAGYGILNVKDAKNELDKPQDSGAPTNG